MTTIERRALYHLLRMNWLNDPSLLIEPWQVEDYRSLILSTLFERLQRFDIHLNRSSFIGYAEACDSPEELTDYLIGDRPFSAKQEDQIYLLIFELWHRLMMERPSVSIICYELDNEIFLYDHQQLKDPLTLQETLVRFVKILDQNVDEGVPAEQAFHLLSSYCANDIEVFLYDFITAQIEEGNESYAHELLSHFDPYWGQDKWFKLLRLRCCETYHSKIAQKIIEEIIEEHLNDQDLDYYLEFLSILAEMQDHASFRLLSQQLLTLIKTEEDFQEFMIIGMDYLHRMHQPEKETTLKMLFEKRSHYPLDKTILLKDPDLIEFAHIFNLKE